MVYVIVLVVLWITLFEVISWVMQALRIRNT